MSSLKFSCPLTPWKTPVRYLLQSGADNVQKFLHLKDHVAVFILRLKFVSGQECTRFSFVRTNEVFSSFFYICSTRRTFEVVNESIETTFKISRHSYSICSSKVYVITFTGSGIIADPRYLRCSCAIVCSRLLFR